jgi:hypothetical protein
MNPVKFCAKPKARLSFGWAAMERCRLAILASVCGVSAPPAAAACFTLPSRPSWLVSSAELAPLLSAAVIRSMKPSLSKSSCAMRAASGFEAMNADRPGAAARVCVLRCSCADCCACSGLAIAAGCGIPSVLEAASAFASTSGLAPWAASRFCVARAWSAACCIVTTWSAKSS